MKRQQKYFNLETYDYTPYARELTEEEMYLVNGGRVVKGSARETEVVPSRPSSSSESGNSSGTSTTSNSVPAATQTTTSSSQTNSSSQQNNTESQPQTSSAPTCTAAQIAAAKGAAANAYFAEQDKKRDENNRQNNNSGSSSSSSSSDNNSTTQSSNSDSENLTDKAYPSSRDENYGQAPSSGSSYVSSNSNVCHKDEPVPGQNLSENAMKDLLMWGDALGNRKEALTPAEQAEMSRQHAEIKKNTIDTKVWIVRNDDGLGNEFNATRYIYKDGKLVYQDVIGANCAPDKTKMGSTTPDGIYYLSNKSVEDEIYFYRQDDGSTNSNSFKNVLSLRTSDRKLPEETRAMINIGDRLFHCDEWYDKDTNTFTQYSKYNHPCGAGCMISHTQQAHDEMMSVLMDGVYNPSAIQVNIVSLSNLPGFYK